jgi:hypothetical protein
MTATSISTSNDATHGQRVVYVVRRMALGAGRLVAGIGSRWNGFVESGQLGPRNHQSISRHTGSRI